MKKLSEVDTKIAEEGYAEGARGSGNTQADLAAEYGASNKDEHGNTPAIGQGGMDCLTAFGLTALGAGFLYIVISIVGGDAKILSQLKTQYPNKIVQIT